MTGDDLSEKERRGKNGGNFKENILYTCRERERVDCLHERERLLL